MDPARFERVQELFHVAVQLTGAERDQFLAGVEGELREELASLLAEDDGPSSLMDRGAAIASVEEIPEELLAKAFGPNRLEKLPGEGGMGLVFLGRRDDLGSLAAIKVLRDAWLSPERRARFLAEQRALAELRHPSIAMLYDADTLPDGTPWFAMEYVAGLPLTEYCEGRASDLRERLRLFRCVCEAVQHAHRHGIIHRDLKPSNVLVSEQGEVKLLDFGIAKQIDTADGLTRTGPGPMTPPYAAPEQQRGEATGIYTDVYGLGNLLYELLVGRLPNGGVPSAAGHVTATGAEWRDLDVLSKTALHPEPNRRYGSVEALLRDLDHFRAGEPLEARLDGWRYRAGKFVRRHRLAVAAATAAIILVSGLTLVCGLRLREARNTAVAEAARSQRMMRFVLNLFDGGDQYAGPAKDLRVVTLLDRGAGEARALSGDPEAQAELYRTLGGVERKLGNLEKADALLREAVAQGKRPTALSLSLLELALLRADQAQFDEVERLAREGVALSRRIEGGLADALDTLGKVLEEEDRIPPPFR